MVQPPVLPGDHLVGGRLKVFWKNWEVLGVDESVLNIVRYGYRISFSEKPPLSTVPWFLSVPRSMDRRMALEDTLSDLLEQGVVEEVLNQDSPGFYNHFFVTPKGDGRWRPILNLTRLNDFVVKEHFKMETAESIRESLGQGEWVTSLDFTSAYHHIGIHPKSRKYLRFAIGGKVYQYRALPMGLTSSARIFTKVIKVVKELLQRFAIRFHQYLDDWLIRGRSRVEADRHTILVHQVAECLGFLVNLKKSELCPTQAITFLSYRFDLVNGRVSPTEERWDKLQRKLLPFLTRESRPAQAWQSLLGLLAATEKLVNFGLLKMRPIQVALADQWAAHHDSPSAMVIIGHNVRPSLLWWTDRRNVMGGVPMNSTAIRYQVYSDASSQGWGGHLEDQEVSGIWNPEEGDLHVNLLEMLSAHNVLWHFREILNGHTVMLATDNTTVVSYVKRQGGTKSRSLLRQTEELYGFLEDYNIVLKCRHIPGRLNVLADGLSRRGQVLATEWALEPAVVQMLWQVWDRPTVDLFATRYNHQLPIYVSPVPDGEAWGVDALSLSWQGLLAYAFPPTAILMKVLNKVYTSESVVILVAPYWPKQSWFPLLLDLLVDFPVKLPDRAQLLK